MKDLTLKQMVEKYNELTGKNITKFRDRATAEKKLAEVMPKKAKAEKVRKSSKLLTAKIKVLVTENPRKEGSNRANQFELYEDGMTVEEFLASGGRRRSIRRDKKQGLIELV